MQIRQRIGCRPALRCRRSREPSRTCCWRDQQRCGECPAHDCIPVS